MYILLERAINISETYTLEDLFSEKYWLGGIDFPHNSTNYLPCSLGEPTEELELWLTEFRAIFHKWHRTELLDFDEEEFLKKELRKISMVIENKYNFIDWRMKLVSDMPCATLVAYQFSQLMDEYHFDTITDGRNAKKFKQCYCGRIFMPRSIRQKYCKNWDHA